jgi:hypothetical protein
LYAYPGNNPVNGIISQSKNLTNNSNSYINVNTNINSANLSCDFSLPKLSWLAQNATNIAGGFDSIFNGYHAASFVWQNRAVLKDVTKIEGYSFTKYINNLSGSAWKIGGMDYAFLGIDAALDFYDSLQKGVSLEGALMGAGLTGIKGIGLIYASKGLIYGLSALGTMICPGAGTVIGFVVGTIISVVGGYFLGLHIDKKINDFIDWLF